MPYFRRLENLPTADPERRGTGGPLRVTDRALGEPDPLSAALIESCIGAGIAPTADYNALSFEGVLYLEQTVHRGRRWTHAVAYLRSARSRPNSQIRTHALGSCVLFPESRADGVEFVTTGVGDPARLQTLGIPVVATCPEVSENLVEHLQVRCTYETRLPITTNDRVRSPWIRLMAGLRYVFTRKGLLTGTSSTAQAITRSTPARTRADVMVQIYHFSGRDRYSRSPGQGMDPYSGTGISCGIPSSTGIPSFSRPT